MDALGIELPQIIFYIISFLLAMIVLNKFVFSSVVNIMNEREATIKAALDERDGLKAKMDNVQIEADNIISEAKSQARNILEEAATQIQPQQEKIIQAATEQGNHIVEQAQKHAKEIVAQAQSEGQQEALEILKKISHKALNNMQLDAGTSQQVLEEIIKSI